MDEPDILWHCAYSSGGDGSQHAGVHPETSGAVLHDPPLFFFWGGGVHKGSREDTTQKTICTLPITDNVEDLVLGTVFGTVLGIVLATVF